MSLISVDSTSFDLLAASTGGFGVNLSNVDTANFSDVSFSVSLPAGFSVDTSSGTLAYGETIQLNFTYDGSQSPTTEVITVRAINEPAEDTTDQADINAVLTAPTPTISIPILTNPAVIGTLNEYQISLNDFRGAGIVGQWVITKPPSTSFNLLTHIDVLMSPDQTHIKTRFTGASAGTYTMHIEAADDFDSSTYTIDASVTLTDPDDRRRRHSGGVLQL